MKIVKASSIFRHVYARRSGGGEGTLFKAEACTSNDFSRGLSIFWASEKEIKREREPRVLYTRWCVPDKSSLGETPVIYVCIIRAALRNATWMHNTRWTDRTGPTIDVASCNTDRSERTIFDLTCGTVRRINRRGQVSCFGAFVLFFSFFLFFSFPSFSIIFASDRYGDDDAVMSKICFSFHSGVSALHNGIIRAFGQCLDVNYYRSCVGE